MTPGASCDVTDRHCHYRLQLIGELLSFHPRVHAAPNLRGRMRVDSMTVGVAKFLPFRDKQYIVLLPPTYHENMSPPS